MGNDFQNVCVLGFHSVWFCPLSVKLSFWRTKCPRWSLESVKSRAAPSENLHLSVSCTEITVQFPRLLSNLSAAQRRGMDEGRSYRQHGISLSFLNGKCGSAKVEFGKLSALRDKRSTNLIGLFQEVSEWANSQSHAEVLWQLIHRETSGASCWVFGCSTGFVLIGSDWQWNRRTQNFPTLGSIYSLWRSLLPA